MTKPIAIVYGSSTCYTEMVAESLADLIGVEKVELINVAEKPLSLILEYKYLIFGIPTWDYGELQEDWDENWDELDELDLSGKTAAIFGLGDQVGYPQWFQDGIGYLYHKISERGARLVGSWPAGDYQFEQSKGLSEDGSHFLGLALDEENQAEQTPVRLKQWLQSIAADMPLQP